MIQNLVINKILKTKDASLLTLNDISSSYFCDYTSEYAYILNHLNKYGNVPDIATFLNVFPSFDIIEVQESSDFLIAEIRKDKSKRELATTFNDVREKLISDDVNGAMALMTHAVESFSKNSSMQCLDIFDDTSRFAAYVDKGESLSKHYVTTGFPELDKIIGGWDRFEELVTIVARPNIGKSWILLMVALAAAKQGLKVGIYSGEMSEQKVAYRIDTLLSNISNKQIIRGDVSVSVQYKTYLEKVRSQISGTIKVITPAMIDGPAGVMALRSFIEKEQLDMLCIDQHSLLEDDRKAKNPIEKAANISKDLKILQTLKKIPIIAVSQQNRTSTESGVSVAQVAQTDRIGQDSTIVIFLEQEDGVMTLKLIKSRDSENNMDLKYTIDFDKGRMIYLPFEGDMNKGEACADLQKQFDYAAGEEVF